MHPGTVDTEVQKAWTETYGSIFGKILEKGSQLLGKTAPEGAEAGLWAATSTDIFEGNWKDYQVILSYFEYPWLQFSLCTRATITLRRTASRTSRRTRRRALN